jgi:hypothetical protein
MFFTTFTSLLSLMRHVARLMKRTPDLDLQTMLPAEGTSLQDEISSRDLLQHLIASARVPGIFIPDSNSMPSKYYSDNRTCLLKTFGLQAKSRTKRI